MNICEAWWNTHDTQVMKTSRTFHPLIEIKSPHLCQLFDSLWACVRLGQETSTQIVVNWNVFQSESNLQFTASMYTRNVGLNTLVLGVLVDVLLVVWVNWGSLQEGWSAVKVSVYPLENRIDMSSLVFVDNKFQEIAIFPLMISRHQISNL